MRWLALVLLLPTPLAAQSTGCVEQPRGANLPVTVLVPRALPGRPGAWVEVPVDAGPSHGQDCVAADVPVPDVLRGVPAPGGVLQGEPVAPRTRVTVQPR